MIAASSDSAGPQTSIRSDDGDAPATEETRARILSVAEDLFRTYGYNKTTMADIAAAASMSAGNVYRFFDNKADLMGQIAEHWLYTLDQETAAVAFADGPAEQRLVDFVRRAHRLTRERHLHDRKVHELCALVIREHWPAVRNHIDRFNAAIAHILADGTRHGEFAVTDPQATARLISTALIKFDHPVLVAEFFAEDMEDEAEALVRLLIHGLRAG